MGIKWVLLGYEMSSNADFDQVLSKKSPFVNYWLLKIPLRMLFCA